MLIYEYRLRDEITRVKDLAERLRTKFVGGADPEDLAQDAALLESAFDHLRQLLPDGINIGNASRHLAWIKSNLNRRRSPDSLGDIRDICEHDLPGLEKSFRDWCASYQHYDPEFAAKLGDLISQRHLDSAIRKGFVLLRERMARAFGISTNEDGQDLVNRVFGNKGSLAGNIPESERQAMRDLLAGLYGVFRNPYGHNDLDAEWFEAEAALSMINWVLKRIDHYSLSGLREG